VQLLPPGFEGRQLIHPVAGLVYNSDVPFQPHPNTKFLSRLTRIIQGVLLLFLAFSLVASLRTGLANNGDFERVMTWFTSGPANMPEDWPALNTPEYHDRFFIYFIPDWKLDFPLKGTFSSVELLWLPGVLLNWLFYSKAVLSMNMVGLIPRLLSLLILWLAFRWINYAYHPPPGLEPVGGLRQGGEGEALVLTLTLGVPLTMLLGSGAYLAYFNSFYQETGSFVFLFLFIAALIYAWRVDYIEPRPVHEEGHGFDDGESIELKEPMRPHLWPRFLALAALLCLLTSKASNFYWVIACVLLVVPWREVLRRPKAFIPLYIGIAVTLALVVALIPSRPDLRRNNYFQSLFKGALTFSKEPAQRLEDLGLKGAKKCVYQSAFYPTGNECIKQFGDKISFLSTAQVILHEPLILFRTARYAAQNMQGLTLQLGKYEKGAKNLPRIQTILLGAWSSFKERYFPRSLGLLVTLAFFTVFFVLNLKGSHGMRRELAMLGLLATLACFIDMNVQVLGDGRADIVKHLFLANLLFDLAAIAALNVGVICFLFDRTRITSESG
jgi:hypothetical protein